MLSEHIVNDGKNINNQHEHKPGVHGSRHEHVQKQGVNTNLRKSAAHI